MLSSMEDTVRFLRFQDVHLSVYLIAMYLLSTSSPDHILELLKQYFQSILHSLVPVIFYEFRKK